MCWVKLNVFCLENSLHNLSHTFGNISSNRKDLSIFIKMFQDLRFNLEPVVSLFRIYNTNFNQFKDYVWKMITLQGNLNWILRYPLVKDMSCKTCWLRLHFVYSTWWQLRHLRCLLRSQQQCCQAGVSSEACVSLFFISSHAIKH